MPRIPMAYGGTMQFPFDALDSGAIVVRRPLRRCEAPGLKPVRVIPTSDPLVVAYGQAVRYGARENIIWVALFLSALVLLAISFAV